MARVNLVIGTKGGIGKSFIAATLAQYAAEAFAAAGRKGALCYDIDPNCRTFSSLKALNVSFLDIITEKEIDKRKFDALFQNICNAEKEDMVIIDSGGNTYIPRIKYMTNNEIFSLLLEEKHQVALHIPISGGAELLTTMRCFAELGIATPPEVYLVPWLNPFHGSLEYKGQTFEHTTFYRELSARIPGIVTLPAWASDMAMDVTELLKSNRTFEEGIQDHGNNIVVRQRLRTAKRKLYTAIQAANLL